MEEVIYLEDDYDIAMVRQRLEQTPARRVLLVVPKRCKALVRAVDLRLLQRYVDALAVEVALVTKNRATRVLAREAGFAVFSSVKRGQRARWRGPLAGQKTVSTRQWLVNALAFVLLSGLLLSLIAVAFLIVPEATVTLVPDTEAISHTVEVCANPDIGEIDFERAEIPAREMETSIEGRAQTAPAARKDVPDARATGTVIFVNKRNEPTTVPQGTIVRTSAGSNFRFRTIEEVTLPATMGGKAEVGIVAVDPGLSGNIDAWKINTVEGVAALWVEVINDTSTRGGTVKRVSVVTAEDKNRLRASLLQRLQQEAYNRLREQLGEEEFVFRESVVIASLDEVFDRVVDEQADVLNLEMRASAKGTTIRVEDARALAQRALESKVKDGFQLMSQALELQPGEVTRIEGRKVYFEMGASGLMAEGIDEAGIKEGIQGKPIAAARDYLRQLRLSEEPSLEVRPGWLGRVPFLPFRIRILVATEGG